MKIAIVADLHLNKRAYTSVMDKEFSDIPFRYGDNMRSFRWIVGDIIDNQKPDMVVIAGDVYDYYDVNNTVRGFFSDQCSRLLGAGIPVIVLIGNHDVCMRHHALKDISELGLKSIKVIEEPKIISYKGYDLLLFPYSMEVERQNKTEKEEFKDFQKLIAEKCGDNPRLLFGHIGVKGGKINEYNDLDAMQQLEKNGLQENAPKKAFVNTDPNAIDLDDLDSVGAEYVFLGDFHEHQRLKTKKCIALYTGSIEKTNIADRSKDKGYVVFDDQAEEEGDLKKCRFIKYPNCRSMVEFKGTLKDMRKQLEDLDVSAYQEAIVKVSFVGTQKELFEYSSGLHLFKKGIEEKLSPIYYTDEGTKVEIDKKQEEEASKLMQDIDEKGHISDRDVLDVANELIDEMIEDEDELKALKKLNEEIYEAVGGGK